MNRWLGTLAALLLIATSAHAQTSEGRWSVGVHGGLWKQIGGDADYSNVGPVTGLQLRRGLSDALTLDLGLRYGWTRLGVEAIGEEAGLTLSSEGDLYTRIWQPSLAATYRIASEGKWRPWVTAGAAVTRWDVRDLTGEDAGLWPSGSGVRVLDEDGETVDGHGVDLTGIVGVGTEIVAGENWSFDVGVRYHHLFGQDRDSVGFSAANAPDGTDANSGLLEGLIGVNFAFGTLDRDGDGTADRHDADPDNAEDMDGRLDSDGAPDLDNDGDGVPDVEDGAPNHPEDFDGFEDADGVPDPDNDGDGVNDAQDRCPGTPRGTEVDAEGCPVAEEIRGDLVLEGVSFASGSAELTSESIEVLRRVAESLKAWPEARVEVGGHTDSNGAAARNRELSQERAESVRRYLVDQGVESSRVIAVGYGEDRPIVDDATAEGRATNRRVELRRIGTGE